MSSPASQAGGAGAPVNVRTLILVLATLTAFAPFATDMYLASFSQIAESYATDLGTVQLGLSVFFLGMAVGQPIYGPLVDRYGRKSPLLVGVSVFALSSLALAFAPTIDSFVVLRFVQAIGGCAGMIVARAVIRDLFDEQEGARVLSLMMAVMGMAPVLAPVVGSYILLLADWRAIFLFLAVWGIVGLIAIWRVLPDTLAPADRRRESLVGILAAYRALVLRRAFVVPALASGFVFGGLFAFISGSPYVYMELHGINPQLYAWLFALNACGMVVASQVNRIALKHFSVRTIFFAALGTNLVAAAVLVAVASASSIVWLLIPLWFAMASVPLVGANAVAIAMSATGHHAGSGSAIIGLLQFVFASFASALVGFFHNGTAYPMAVTILICSLLAITTWGFGRERG